VQRAVYEPAIRGRDLVVQARTGTGKTAAFGLPLVDNLVKRGTPAVQALVLCPTRELALQVTREVDALSKYRGVRCVPVYGGAPMPRQIEAIRQGAQIVIGTPGRVLDHLRRRTFDASNLRVVVLDESDEMLSMGFLPQINDIFSFLPESKQTLLFSATLPRDIRRMAETRLRNPEFLTLSGDHIGALEIQHFVYLCQTDKLQALIQIIEVDNPESAIIFCNTRDETKRVAGALEQQGFAADWLNADLAQNERETVMAATRKGELRFLVATDVAARGIDISHLTHVINFDFPESPEGYVHRTGRTGRAGRTGTAVSLLEPSDIGNLYLLRLTYKLKPIERQLPSAREIKTRAETDLVKLFVEGLGMKKPHPDDLALARRLVSHELGELCVASLLRDHLGARPDAVDEATAARRARAPAPAVAGEELPPSSRLAQPAERERTTEKLFPLADTGRGQTPRQNPPKAARPPAPVAVREPLPIREAMPAPAPKPVPAPLVVSPAHAAVVPKAMDAVTSAEEGNDDAGNSDPSGEEVSEIYVNVGRRDGAKPSDYQAALEGAGVSVQQTDYIRVRHRHAFVGVRPEHVARALEALNGATIAGKRASAERARRV
jgi:ATP-dependent RNA helicase DeaD